METQQTLKSHTHNGILLIVSHKKYEILSLVMTWMTLRIFY